jgi:hypothetical protein
MENVDFKVSGTKLVITVDLKHRGELSSSGKTIRVASTLGNVKVPETEVTVGLNAYVKP